MGLNGNEELLSIARAIKKKLTCFLGMDNSKKKSLNHVL